MRTRPEQVQAYRFVTRRIVGALLSGEPETTDHPTRRLGMALFASTMVGVIIFAAIGVYALLVPGGGTPEAGQVLIERESGARYYYNGDDKLLYPVINYASARLIAGADAEVETMSQASLRGLPRSPSAVGIPGAPDALPAPKSLLGLPWSVCSAARTRVATSTTVSVGSTVAGGVALGESALVVAVDGNPQNKYVLWNDRRMRVREQSYLVALNLAAADAVPVGEAFLNGVAAGPDLALPRIPDLRKASRVQVGGRPATIGQTYRFGEQRYVLLADGLAPIGEVTEALLTAEGMVPREITAGEAGRLQVSVKVEDENFPRSRLRLRATPTDGSALCAAYRGGDAGRGRTAVEIFDRAPADLSTVDAVAGSGGAVRTADRVLVAGGRGALVRTLPAPGVAGQTTLYLVTDLGVKYPLVKNAKHDAAAALGYAGVTPVPVPAELLALVPTGPTLDPDAARLFATPTGATQPQSRPSKGG